MYVQRFLLRSSSKLFVLASAFGVWFGIVNAAYAANSRDAEIRIFDGSSVTEEHAFFARPEGTHAGTNLVVGNVTSDAAQEIVVGAGDGGQPTVRVFNSAGTPVAEFSAYTKSIRGGVTVAACDFDQDGVDEIITGTGQGGGPQVRVFGSDGTAKFSPGFFAFSAKTRGGVQVACGDVDGDGANDIVAGSGVGLAPKVKVFDRAGNDKHLDLTPYADRDRGGVAVAVGNTDGGKEAEIITAIHKFGRSRIKVYKTDKTRTILAEFEGWPETIQGGIALASADLTGDGKADILAGIANGDSPQVLAFTGKGRRLKQNFFAYEQDFHGGVRVAAGDVDGDGTLEIVTGPGKNTVQGSTDYRKYIEVRLNEQRLYAYENGFLKKTFLVSTGIPKYPTPPGTYSVLAKVPKKDYEWSYGENDPDNYDIKDVPWNLRFDAHLYLHNAYWHNNFGRVMSHGCVNINLANAKWLYEWADIGIPVIIKGPQPF